MGKIFLYNLLGVLCFFGLGVTIPWLLLNHFASKTISGAFSLHPIPSRSILNADDGYRQSKSLFYFIFLSFFIK
jgi:hypothetical protein